LIWGLHHSNFSLRANKVRTLAVIRACAALSYCAPSRIVCCSEAVRKAHCAIGYNPRKLVVIPNGYDTERFRPDENSGSALRYELGIPKDAPVVSLMARFHPQKNHESFIEAASIVHQRRPDTHFVLCGYGVVWENQSLAGPIAARGLACCFHLLGPVGDAQRILAGSTVLASSSLGEGMSNVIAEAMACGTVCVVTDVGESANVVGDAGFVVPPEDDEALACALLSAIGLSAETRRSIGAAARRRIGGHFGLSQTVHLYQTLYEAVAEDSGRPYPDRHRAHHELPTT
jgi:glycosyltransferase involved in cell wall biosynthesis